MAQNNGKSDAFAYKIELLSAILLSLATLGSTWCAYQASLWGGVQATRYTMASSLRAEAVRKTNIAARKINIDVGLFVEYAAAISQDNPMLAEFLFDRFRPELKKATQEWLKTKPLKNPNAPRHPFELKEYVIIEQQEADSLIAKAEQRFEEGRNANKNSDQYVLFTVLFASVLFFAGIGVKFRTLNLEFAMLLLGIVVFITALVGLLFLPIQ